MWDWRKRIFGRFPLIHTHTHTHTQVTTEVSNWCQKNFFFKKKKKSNVPKPQFNKRRTHKLILLSRNKRETLIVSGLSSTNRIEHIRYKRKQKCEKFAKGIDLLTSESKASLASTFSRSTKWKPKKKKRKKKNKEVSDSYKLGMKWEQWRFGWWDRKVRDQGLARSKRASKWHESDPVPKIERRSHVFTLQLNFCHKKKKK